MNDSELLKECMRLVPLGFWLELCQRAGVPYVPADFSEPFPVADLTRYLDLEPTPALQAALDWGYMELLARVEAGGRWVFRWECCSSSSAKCAAARGRDYCDEYFSMLVDDPRVQDCTVGLQSRICLRPWIAAKRIGGYPVEFRAFAGPNGPLGISNYYPQRDLEDSPELRAALLKVAVFMDALCQHEAFPAGFTADFLVLPDDSVMLLEGGPPHVRGPVSAHPCCFPEFQIDGIALAKRPGALSK